jgi:dTDP-4-amino-4,6-dideoxygalactose transaminase
MTPLSIPLVNLGRQYDDLGAEIDGAIRQVCMRGDFILGQAVGDFERGFADFVGARHCIGVGNGTDALHLVLRALGVGAGHEVIVPANTFIATAEAVSYCGATPVLVDCDDRTATIDVDRIAAALTPRTKAIIPVHLYGQPADMDPILALGASHGVQVIEDAAQAHGASYRGRPCGGLARAAAFSFYPGKNLGAYGDAGAVVTNDDGLAEEVRLLRNWGSPRKYVHSRQGYNSRLDTLQAAVLSVKLPRLQGWNGTRVRLASLYREVLSSLHGTIDVVATREATTAHAYHLFVVRLRQHDRDAVLAKLQSEGIGAGVHYPIPIHLQEAYRHLGHGSGSFPAAERLAREVLSLPLCPYLTEAEALAVADRLRRLVGG